MNWLKRHKVFFLHIIHSWIVTEGNYNRLGLVEPGHSPHRRVCTVCGKTQEMEMHCLGLNPPDYVMFWYDVKK